MRIGKNNDWPLRGFIAHGFRRGCVRVAVSDYAILIDIIWNFVIATAGCIELLNHKISTITG
jgi:hypothetical protein